MFFCKDYANSANRTTSRFQGTRGPSPNIMIRRSHFLWDGNRKVAVTVTGRELRGGGGIAKFPPERSGRGTELRQVKRSQRIQEPCWLSAARARPSVGRGIFNAGQRELCVSAGSGNDTPTCTLKATNGVSIFGVIYSQVWLRRASVTWKTL